MSDFSPDNRKRGFWSTDCRRIVSGNLIRVIQEKQGVIPIVEPERSEAELESMAMGLKMQDTIARLFEDEFDCRLKPLDGVELSHPEHAFICAHFDFVSDDGKFLVETKNYHGMSIKSFSDQDEPVKVPTADYVQCLHEAIVYGVSTVFLAVLFGGQRFRTYRFDFSEEEKLAHIEYLCGLWKHVQDGTLPTAESYEDAKLSFTRDNGNNIVANADIEMIVEALAGVKASIKALEEREAFLQGKIMVYMGEHSELINISGEKLATWKAAKPSQVFDMTLFKTMSPDLHKRFLVEKPGSRRFLVK